MFNRLYAVISKELIQYTRDRILFAATLLAPLIQIVLLGNAVGSAIRNLQVAVVDYDHSPLSREIITALDNTDELVVAYFPGSLEEAQKLVDRGQAIGVVVIPPGFMEETRSPNSTAEMQVILDGTQTLTAGYALSAASEAVQSLVSGELPAGGSLPGVVLYPEPLYNRALDLQPDAITAQLALITFEMVALVGVMGIVRERDIGTIEMLSITPLKRMELIAGKTLTPLMIGLATFSIVFTMARVVFDVPNRGSLLLLIAVTTLYLLCEIGYGLALSSLLRTQQQAVTVVFVWIMVALTLSGYLVPIEQLPQAFQWLSWLLPLRHYLRIEHNILLKGSGLLDLWPQIAAIGVLTVLAFAIAPRLLNRVLE
ncbi:MAG: ABC transporter permease [Anaerolineae bacterium]